MGTVTNKDQKAEVVEKGNVQSEATTYLKSKYALYSLATSAVIGLAASYLFFWKVPGISAVIFMIFLTSLTFAPIFFIGGKEIKKRVGWNILPMLFAAIFTIVFAYRLAPGILVFSVLLLPMIYSLFTVAAFNPEVLKEQGVLKTCFLPFVMLFAWFADIIGLAKNLKLQGIRSERSKSVIRRVLTGVIVALPFLLLFLIMFSAADQVFAKYVIDAMQSVFGNIFKDFETFMSFVMKVALSGMIAIYFAIFNFSLYNPDSSLRKYMKNSSQFGIRAKRNWDGFTVSVFLTMINVLFFIFVAIQFFYLFSGDQNVIGSEANFTYAQYARRGFFELLIVALTVSAIVYVLNQKTNIVSAVQKWLYAVNYVALLLFTFIISISAHMRLWLIEGTYGFTSIRLTGHYIYLIVDLLLLILLIALFIKEKSRFAGTSLLALLFASFVIYFAVPLDMVVAEANLARYEKSGKIDLPYMTTLSDEAIPTLVKLYNSDSIGQPMKSILSAHLNDRYEDIKEQRKLWQEFNFFHSYNKALLKDMEEQSIQDRKDAETSLKSFLDEYAEYLEARRFAEAHEKFWSENTKMMDKGEFRGIEVSSYKYRGIPLFDEWDLLGEYARQDLYSDSNFDYWTGMYVRSDMWYRYKGINYCTQDNLRVKLENGEWKIMRAYSFNLGVFEDKGLSRYYFENSDMDHLRNPTSGFQYGSGGDCYVK